MSHHYSGPDWGFPHWTPAWTSPICMPSRSQETLASLECPTIEAAKAAHSSASWNLRQASARSLPRPLPHIQPPSNHDGPNPVHFQGEFNDDADL